ncbi:serine/threonine-protein kinase haspin [Ixodes scapularis]|uniref:serine/threonine-protein kinase haspin n=1 Tax=Ixodes scapularis TaxID=6945 RepID=UPI001C393EEB|nr:serine/threonine-protein kinase haspin [Ixodes scapularis]
MTTTATGTTATKQLPLAYLLNCNNCFCVNCNNCHWANCSKCHASPAYLCRSLRSCRKIGEGLYGEVFRLQRGSETSVVKIVPVGGSVLVNTEQQKSVEQILPEVIISLDLSSLRNQASSASCRSFIEFKRVHCVQDTYHRVLLKQWDLFDSKKGSENDRPDFYEASQMFVVFEFADGGESLECFKIRTAGEAESIFLQVACALAVAEVALEYEHRDLHWGNLLVTRTPEKRASYRLPEGTFDLDTCGVSVSLIDYSLSRLRNGGTVIFTDLSEDASLFEGTGDHQFEVYRLMKQHNGNDWKSFSPYTNVLWLHYLLQKLLQEKHYRKTGIRHNAAVGRLCNWANLVLLCNSASEFVRNCSVTERNPSPALCVRRRNIRV